MERLKTVYQFDQLLNKIDGATTQAQMFSAVKKAKKHANILIEQHVIKNRFVTVNYVENKEGE